MSDIFKSLKAMTYINRWKRKLFETTYLVVQDFSLVGVEVILSLVSSSYLDPSLYFKTNCCADALLLPARVRFGHTDVTTESRRDVSDFVRQ